MSEDQELQPSAADDIGTPEEVITLPYHRTRRGDQVRIKIRLVELGPLGAEVLLFPMNADVAPPAGGNGAGPAASFKASLDDYKKWEEPAKRIAALGIVWPPFSYDARELGKVYWGDLRVEDKAFIIRSIQRVSGIGAEETRAARQFPDGAAAGHDDAGDVGGGPDSAPAAQDGGDAGNERGAGVVPWPLNAAGDRA